MKMAIFSVMLIFILNSYAGTPQCTGGTWVLDGFALIAGGGDCKDRLAACQNIGTSDEGWYSFSKKGSRFLGYAKCRADFIDGYEPTCRKIGSRSEGWYMAGSMMSWSKCSEESVACIGQGTRNEGWYSFKKDSVKKILPLACSEDI